MKHHRALWVALMAVSCGREERFARSLVDAIRDEDLKTVLSVVHADYSDVVGGRADLVQDLTDLLNEASIKQMEVSDWQADRRPNAGRVLCGACRLEMDGATQLRATFRLCLELSFDPGLSVRSGLFDDVRQIRQLFRARRAALEANDVDAYLRLLHPAYRDGDENAQGVVARLKADLPGTAIRLHPESYFMDVRDDVAHVDERYRLTVDGHETPIRVGRFTLRRSAGLWRIAAGV